MSTWVGMAPVIGTGSLDGFAIGALMSGACVLAITAPRRVRSRQAGVARSGGVLAAEQGGWLCEHVMAAEAVGARMAVATGAAAEDAGAGGESKAPGGYRSRHRRHDPLPGSLLRGPWDGMSRGDRDDAARNGSAHDGAHPGDASPGGAAPGGRHGAHPDLVFPDEAFGDHPSGGPRRSGVRRMPRHAAPPVSLSSRLSGFGSRMTGLPALRALASGARG